MKRRYFTVKDKIIIDNDTELDLDDLSDVSGAGGKSGAIFEYFI